MRPESVAGRYELVEQISSGGMGQVWRGYDAVLDREVAVKLIRTDVIASADEADEFARRFRREARVTGRIRHHGVPQVYDAVLDQSYDRVYLVMEFVHGTSLRDYINPDAPVPVPWAAALAAQISTVLSHAHAIPVVHRDLKPDNVLVTDAGAVKVLDFGIAAVLGDDVTRLTATGQTLGTHRYMSPEQIRGAQIAPQSDLYALGCLLHELLAGRPMFDGRTGFELMRQHMDVAPIPLRQLRPDVPEAIEELVLRLTAKTPERRPRDAYETYERLLPFLPLPGTAPPAAHLPSAVPDPTLLYRRPNAPRPRTEPSTRPGPALAVPPQPAGGVLDTALRGAMDEAVSHSDELLDQERYAQAAEALQQAITSAAAQLGPESPRILRLRQRRAAILLLGGDCRAALPEFDALAVVFARTRGRQSEEALDCLREAAHCRAELGHATTALNQFRHVLALRRKAEGDASPAALDLRRDIVMLLLAEGNLDEAEAELVPLYDDLRVVRGPDHAETREIGDILARLRLPPP